MLTKHQIDLIENAVEAYPQIRDKTKAKLYETLAAHNAEYARLQERVKELEAEVEHLQAIAEENARLSGEWETDYLIAQDNIEDLESRLQLARELMPDIDDEVAAALVAWVGRGGDEARSVSFRFVGGLWLVRIAEEHTLNSVEKPTLYECWRQLVVESNPSPKEPGRLIPTKVNGNDIPA